MFKFIELGFVPKLRTDYQKKVLKIGSFQQHYLS